MIGQSVARVDGHGKLTGDAVYAGDVSFQDMLYLRILRSDRPHAKILEIRTDAAKRHPGVVAVFTHKDIPAKNRIGAPKKERPVLCDEKVRFIGDPVVLVAAESLEAAEEALSLIQIDYKDLPGVFSPEDALLPDAIRIHETGNLVEERTLLKGDPDQGLKAAEVVITNTYRTHMVEHAYLEPESGVANYVEGKLTVWMPSKYSHSDRMELAAILGLPLNNIRIINATIGGYFGDKTSLSPGYYAALVTFKTKRPSKMVYTREESFFASRKRHPFIIHYTTGTTREGLLVVAKVEVTGDTGAYAESGPNVLMKALVHATGPYEIPNVFVRTRCVYTNNPVAGSMRGLGVPQMAVAHESQIDILAKTLHLDPFDIRLRNGLKPGSITATGQPLGESVGLATTLERVKDEISRKGTPRSSVSKRYGWGVGSMFYGIGGMGRASPGVARIEADDSGRFTLYIGIGDGGQGSSTVLSQIAAEVLGCRPEEIRLVAGDTDYCPDSGVTAGSRVTYIVGRAVQIAAEKLTERLQGAASSIMEIDPENLRLRSGLIYDSKDPRRSISLAQVVRSLKDEGTPPMEEGFFDPQVKALDPKTGQGKPFGTYGFATQGALVSLDMDSGQVEVLSLVACHDVGRAINPASVTGQIEGAVSMGLGFATMEEVLLEEGRIINPHFSQYLIPTSLDMPEIIPHVVESPESSGPFGAKGVGEPALIPTAPAILNAISAAADIRVKVLPASPESLWKLLNSPAEKRINEISGKV